MKLKPYSIAILFAAVLIFGSCHKYNNQDNKDDNIDNFLDLKVSETFLFESFVNLETSIKVDNTKASGVTIIQIFDADPANGGKLILTGSLNENGVFDLPIRIASRLKEVWVGKLSSIGANEYVPVEVTGSTIQLDFASQKSVKDNDPCNLGCTSTVSGTQNGNFTITSGEIVCVTTSATFKKLHINSGGTLRVCGNVTVTNYQGGSGEGLLLINDAGTVTLPKHSVGLTIENYGNLNFAGNGANNMNGVINNWGDISLTIPMINKGYITNNGEINTSERFTNNPGATFINNCEFKINKAGNNSFIQNSDFTNNGYVYVKGKANFTGSGNKATTLGVGSLIDTDDFSIEGNIIGPNTEGSQITADDDGKVTGDAIISGYVDLCADDDDYNSNADYGDHFSECTYNVSPAPQCDAAVAPTINSSLSLGGLVNQTITPYLMTATGSPTITYTMGNLPSGLSWNPTTHAITGTPSTAGTYSVSMTASNFMGSDTKTLVITITQPTAPPVITSVLTDNTTILEDYTYEITATGEPEITYNATNLPDGLTFNSTTNEITGNPTTAGTYNIALSATNGGGTTNETLVLTVGTPPTITSLLTASGTAGVQFNTYTFTATGSPDITYSVASLPQVLEFNATNQTINGTPVSAGTYNVNLTATNSYGTDIETLVITINEGLQPPDITSLLDETTIVDDQYSYTITADGSIPMDFGVSVNDLPDGLTFNGSTISGIPTETGTFNITLTATNNAGTDSELLVLKVETGSGNDTDGDGIPNNEDAYPIDGTRAFNSYYPNEVDFGSFAFEDLWPGYGDYDFNDFVVNFNYKIVTNAQNEVVDVITKFQIMAAGASLNNGFGIVFNAPSATVESVTGCMKFGNAVQIADAGYEVGHELTTVIIPFDAINTIMEGGIVNTIPGGRYIQTTISTVTTHFGTPQTSIGNPPFNPFIFVNQERGHEVHLKNQPPTNLVDEDYFDTYHDASNPPSTYYVSETGLPWGIEVPVNFNYPVEKADILTAYLKFAAWAQSNGEIYDDWYLNESGYRNSANIYVIPQ